MHNIANMHVLVFKSLQKQHENNVEKQHDHASTGTGNTVEKVGRLPPAFFWQRISDDSLYFVQSYTDTDNVHSFMQVMIWLQRREKSIPQCSHSLQTWQIDIENAFRVQNHRQRNC